MGYHPRDRNQPLRDLERRVVEGFRPCDLVDADLRSFDYRQHTVSVYLTIAQIEYTEQPRYHWKR